MKKIINWIKSESGIACFTVLALLVMIAHSAWVFEAISHFKDYSIASKIQAVAFAVSVDLAILVFVLRGRTWLSIGFSIFQVMMNFLYYYERLNSGFDWFAAIFISFSLPIAIGAYSHEIASGAVKTDQDDFKEDVNKRVEELSKFYDDHIDRFYVYLEKYDIKGLPERVTQLEHENTIYDEASSRALEYFEEKSNNLSDYLKRLEICEGYINMEKEKSSVSTDLTGSVLELKGNQESIWDDLATHKAEIDEMNKSYELIVNNIKELKQTSTTFGSRVKIEELASILAEHKKSINAAIETLLTIKSSYPVGQQNQIKVVNQHLLQ